MMDLLTTALIGLVIGQVLHLGMLYLIWGSLETANDTLDDIRADILSQLKEQQQQAAKVRAVSERLGGVSGRDVLRAKLAERMKAKV